MDNTPFISYSVDDRSFVAFIKREIHNQAKTIFSQKRIAEIDLVVSEITSNLVKHAGKGELLYRFYKYDDYNMFEMLCIDSGPGMKDLGHSMRDGISSTQTLGHGLGSISRLSSFSQVYTMADWGTIVFAQVSDDSFYDGGHETIAGVLLGGVCVPKPGEKHCGDRYSVQKAGNKLQIMFGDGLGHGDQAEEAVLAAVTSFQKNAYAESPGETLRQMHLDVKRTRGLVGTVVCINKGQKTIEVCGVGNITTRVYAGLELKNNMSYNGIIGLNIPRTLNSTVIPLERLQTVMMASDGIRSQWNISKYSSILKYHPTIIAAAIYKDYARNTDDMSILVAKIK